MKNNKILAIIREELDMKACLILMLFQVLLIYSKLTNFIDWSWFWVLFPVLSQLSIIIIVMILAIVIGLLNLIIIMLDNKK